MPLDGLWFSQGPWCQIELSTLIGWLQNLSQKGEELAGEPDGLSPNHPQASPKVSGS